MKYLYDSSHRFRELRAEERQDIVNFGNALVSDMGYNEHIALQDGIFTTSHRPRNLALPHVTHRPRNLALPHVNNIYANRPEGEKERYIFFGNDFMQLKNFKRNLVLVDGRFCVRSRVIEGVQDGMLAAPVQAAPALVQAAPAPVQAAQFMPFPSEGALEMALLSCVMEVLVRQWPTAENPMSRQQIEQAAIEIMVPRFAINANIITGRLTRQLLIRYSMETNVIANIGNMGNQVPPTQLLVDEDGDRCYMVVI